MKSATVSKKDIERSIISSDVEKFLNEGGKIKQIPQGISSKEPDGLSKSTKTKLNCK